MFRVRDRGPAVKGWLGLYWLPLLGGSPCACCELSERARGELFTGSLDRDSCLRKQHLN